MHPMLMWIDKHSEEEDYDGGSCIYDSAFKPDGTQLLVAIGRRVIVYDPNDGSVIASTQVHKELVYAVGFSYNGLHYASGSQDKNVMLWNDKHECLIKYSHSDAVQCLAFSPVSDLLLSCSCEDFGVWILKDPIVSKQKAPTRCTCCAWSADGAFYAIGFYDGSISLRSSEGAGTSSTTVGEEVFRVERPGNDPVWSLQFSTPNAGQGELLVAADWSPSVGFYAHEAGKLIHKVDKTLDYDPTGVHLLSNGCFFLAIGSNKMLNLHTKDGNDLGAIAQLDAWPWSMTVCQKPSVVVVGCTDGSLAFYQLMHNTIHALHNDRYTFRVNETDVIVQQLHSQKSTRVRCKDLVRKIAIYHNRLAIQLTDKILIYRQASGDREGEQLEYRLLDRINQKLDCSLLVVCANHVILCQDTRLTCYDLKGIKQREWVMESLIRYIKVIGGPPDRETILVGMRYGLVSKIFVDNPFSVEVVRLKTMIRCLDISASKRRLATVDDDNICVIYDTETKRIINQEPNVTSVAFNSENEELICYSGSGYLNVKSGDFVPYQQKLEIMSKGFIVGFTGKCVYILHMYSMQCVEIPLTSQLVQFREKKKFKDAFALACLGVAEKDWRLLGEDALENLDILIAKKAFHRVRDSRMLMLIYELEEMQKRGASESSMRAIICAHRSRFRQAVQHFQSAGEEQKAMEMFAELQMFDHAQDFLANATPETQRQLLRRKAQWAQCDSKGAQTAADLLMIAGDHAEAIRIMITNDWVDRVASAARKLDRGESALLREIGAYMARRGEFAQATAIFTRIQDFASIVRMHVNAEHWEDALAIVRRNPALNTDVYLPYARWLAEQDRFDEAQIAYSKAGADAEAARVLRQLTENSLRESRFHDASCYFRRRAAQLLQPEKSKLHKQFNEINRNDQRSQQYHQNEQTKNTTLLKPEPHGQKEIENLINKWSELTDFADIYFVYDAIFRYTIEPFTSKSLDILFNMSRYLVLCGDINFVSRVTVLFTLMKLSQHFSNFKTARHALSQLRLLRAPSQYESVIDVAALEIRAKPFADAETYQPMCYSCGTSNPILGAHRCVHCDAAFIYSFSTFEVLPLVEVTLEVGIDDGEADELIRAESLAPFDISRIAMNFKRERKMPRLSRSDLHNIDSNMVFVCTHGMLIPRRYFVKVIEEINISKCDRCQKLFHADDYQMAVLQTGRCPTCRQPYSGGTSGDDDADAKDEGTTAVPLSSANPSPRRTFEVPTAGAMSSSSVLHAPFPANTRANYL